MNQDPAEDNSPEVPTIEEERHFLAQCEYINRSITAVGRMVRRLLDQRGWQSEYSRVDQEVIWSKTLPDGAAQHLSEDDAYHYEEEQARQFHHDTGRTLEPRKGFVASAEAEQHFLAQCEDVNRNITAIGSMICKLLCQRGWQPEESPEDEEEVWSKTFPDGATPHLSDNDAYRYEEEQARQFFRNTGISMKPRKGQKPPPAREQ
jgi:hypothetical protein